MIRSVRLPLNFLILLGAFAVPRTSAAQEVERVGLVETVLRFVESEHADEVLKGAAPGARMKLALDSAAAAALGLQSIARSAAARTHATVTTRADRIACSDDPERGVWCRWADGESGGAVVDLQSVQIGGTHAVVEIRT